jgi:hypothetical protein
MIKKISVIVALLGLVALPTVSTLRAGPVTIENDTVWKDTEGNEILCQGGGIYQEDGVFYWIGQEMHKETTFVGLRCYSSKDLKNWTNRGYMLTPGQHPDMVAGHWVGRPDVIKNPVTNNYVLVFHYSNRKGTATIGFAESDTLYGKDYTYKGNHYLPSHYTNDPATVTFGKDAYVVAALDGNSKMGIFKLDPATYLKIDSVVFTGFNDSGIEAPYLIQKDGKYIWFGSSLAGWDSSPSQYAIADSLAGPWTFKKLETNPQADTLERTGTSYIVPIRKEDKTEWVHRPIYKSDTSYNSQLDFIVPIQGSEGTTYMYCGDRWSNRTGKGPGRYVWLPLSWEGDVPTLNILKSWTIDTATGKWSTAESEQTKSN